jgi:hypothetical protein
LSDIFVIDVLMLLLLPMYIQVINSILTALPYHTRSVTGNDTFTVGNTGNVIFVGTTGSVKFTVGSAVVIFGKDVITGGGLGPSSHGWGPGRGVGL